MGVRERLTEPWGIVSAGVLGGLGGAVTAALAPAAVLGIPVGLAIAGAVFGVRLAVAGLTDRDRRSRDDPAEPGLPEPPKDSVAAGWLRRAEAAVDALRRTAESPGETLLRAPLADVRDQAGQVLADLHRFAGQVTVVERATGAVDTARLTDESAALSSGLRWLPPGPLREERERALRAVADQLAVGQRLQETHETLLARIQSAVLGLESLVARTAELLALHATSDAGSLTAARVAELVTDLEGMRAGLAEAEAVSRSTFAGGTPVAPGGTPGGSAG